MSKLDEIRLRIGELEMKIEHRNLDLMKMEQEYEIGHMTLECEIESLKRQADSQEKELKKALIEAAEERANKNVGALAGCEG